MDRPPDSSPYTSADWLRISDRVRLRYALNDRGRRGAVLVSPGWTESTRKYREVAGDLVEWGYSVFVLDHRSQGESSRLTANPQVTHVGRFEDYGTITRPGCQARLPARYPAFGSGYLPARRRMPRAGSGFLRSLDAHQVRYGRARSGEDGEDR